MKPTTSAMCLILLATACCVAKAVPVTYEMDPAHTFPSFEADHMGISFWRGKFNRTTGTLVLDKAASTGNVAVRIDIDSVDFGLDAMHEQAVSPAFFDVAKYRRPPTRASSSISLMERRHGSTAN